MLLFLYGEESFLRQRKLQEIKERYLSLRRGQFYIRSFDCSQASSQEVLQEIRGNSLFLENKLIIIENPFFNQEIEGSLLEYRNELIKISQVVVFSQEGIVEEEDPLFTFLKKHGKTQEFSMLSGRSLSLWVSQEFLRHGAESSPDARDLLVRAVGNDLWRLSNEIAKLAAYCASGVVAGRDVENLVEFAVEPEIFATVDAMIAKNTRQALALLAEHERHGDQPLRILAAIGFQFRALMAVKEMAGRGLSHDAIVKKTKLHPYVVKKALGAAKNFSQQDLIKGLRRIFDIELGLKTGALEPSGALSWFVLSK